MLAVVAEGDRAVALGEARAIVAKHQGDVTVGGWLKAEQPHDHALKRGRGEQVFAAYDTGDGGLRVVDGAGELIANHAVRADEHEVAGGGGDINRHVAVHEVVEALNTCGDGEPERVPLALGDALCCFGRGERAARAGVDRLTLAVWRGGSSFDFGARAKARIDEASGL